MASNNIHRISSIKEFHRLWGLPKPKHPLISLVDYGAMRHTTENNHISWLPDYYSIALKRDLAGKLRYGQQEYDFDEGLMSFISPGQIINVVVNEGADLKPSGWLLLVHPDFLWNTALATTIRTYDFFQYSTNEALFLSGDEEVTVTNIMRSIEREYHSNIDKFSQEVIVAHLELLLTYAKRFYNRQFITRKISNHGILQRLEELLASFFNSGDLPARGLPTVQQVAESLNVSPNYLTGLLKVLTGLSTQQHIHEKLIQKAKEQLSTTDLSVGEIAYALGFEHSQSFSKLFKKKTDLSPLEFRQSFR